jgi:hypothetical protein
MAIPLIFALVFIVIAILFAFRNDEPSVQYGGKRKSIKKKNPRKNK